MTNLLEAAAEVQRFLQQQGWRFCFIGGLAVQVWGRQRATQYVDITLLTGLGDDEALIERLLERFKSRRPDAARFALAARVLLVEAANGVGVDIALGGLPFEEEIVSRARPREYVPGLSLVTCSAEDLIVLKAFAERGLDWFDVEGILVRQWEKLDLPYIRRQLAVLCEAKGSPDIMEELERLRQKVEARLADNWWDTGPVSEKPE